MSPYLMADGKMPGVALYTRCEDELLAKAELLLLTQAAKKQRPGKAIFGYLDVDPSFTITEFKRGYSPREMRKLMGYRAWILKNGWRYQEVNP